MLKLHDIQQWSCQTSFRMFDETPSPYKLNPIRQSVVKRKKTKAKPDNL